MVIEKRYGFGDPEKLMIGLGWENKSAWDYIQERDKKFHGDYIVDKEEQARMSKMVLMAGLLPYMWDRAEDFRKLVYDALDLKKGYKVLIVGEALEACGFLEEVRKRLENEGEIHAFEMIDVARGMKKKPVGGIKTSMKIGMWRYDYADKFSDEYFDAIFFPQGVHHEIDWSERAKDFVRVLKKGRRIVFAEAMTFGGLPEFRIAVQADALIEAVIKKIFVAMGRDPANCWENPNQPTPKDLERWFTPYIKDIHSVVWSGMMLVYGTKK